MIRTLVLVFALPLTAFGEDPKSKPPADPFDRQQAMLKKEIKSFGGKSIWLMSLGAVKEKLEKEFKADGLRIVIREDLFRIRFPEQEGYSRAVFKIHLKPNGLTLHEFLTVALRDLNAVYLPRPKYLEITIAEEIEPLKRRVETLHERKVSSFGETSIKDMTLGALKDKLEREFRWDELKLVIREDVFRERNPEKESYSRETFKGDLKPNGLTLHEVLTVALADINATYLVRRHFIEITTPEAAVAECYPKGPKGETAAARLRREPLVSLYAEDELGVVLKVLSDRYGKPVAYDVELPVRPGAPPDFRGSRDNSVHAVWTNVPFPTAVRLLAVNADLGVKEIDGKLVITAGKKKMKK